MNVALRRALMRALLPASGAAVGAYGGATTSSDPVQGAIGGGLLGGAAGFGLRRALRNVPDMLGDELARMRSGWPRADWRNLRRQEVIEKLGLDDFNREMVTGRPQSLYNRMLDEPYSPEEQERILRRLNPARRRPDPPNSSLVRRNNEQSRIRLFGKGPKIDDIIADPAKVEDNMPGAWLRPDDDTVLFGGIPDPKAMGRTLRGGATRQPRYDYPEIERLIRSEGLNVHNAVRRAMGGASGNDVNTVANALRRAVDRGTIAPLPTGAFDYAPQIRSSSYDASDLIVEATTPARGKMPSATLVARALEAQPTTVANQLRALIGAARQAVDNGGGSVRRLAKQWNVTADRVRALATREIATRQKRARQSMATTLLPYLAAGGVGSAISTVAQREEQRRAMLQQMGKF